MSDERSTTREVYRMTFHDTNAEVVKALTLPAGEGFALDAHDYADLQSILKWWRSRPVPGLSP